MSIIFPKSSTLRPRPRRDHKAAHLTLLFGLFSGTQCLAEVIDLDPRSYQAVPLDNKPTTIYRLETPPGAPVSLRMDVRRSASILLKSFSKPRRLTALAWQWRHEGTLKVLTAAQQHTKAGDDAYLRIGLLIVGDPPVLPMFAPAWLKSIAKNLTLPVSGLRFLVAGGPSAPATRWPSPYASDITMEAVSSTPTADGWYAVAWHADPPLEIAGLWLMADGDDSASSFTTWIRALRVETIAAPATDSQRR